MDKSFKEIRVLWEDEDEFGQLFGTKNIMIERLTSIY